MPGYVTIKQGGQAEAQPPYLLAAPWSPATLLCLHGVTAFDGYALKRLPR